MEEEEEREKPSFRGPSCHVGHLSIPSSRSLQWHRGGGGGGEHMKARALGKQSGTNLLLWSQVNDPDFVSTSVKWGESHSHTETMTVTQHAECEVFNT